jgi:hypothetical protein
VHEPLSQSLARILEAKSATGGVTLNHLLEETEGRGLYSVMILLCLPFVGPLSVPGMSTPFGAAIGLMALRLARGKPPRMPRRFGDRALPPTLKKIILGGGLKFLRFLEKAIRPRHTIWMSWPAAHSANALLLVLMAFLLALPLPPIPPFTNAFPSYAIILIAASMMEEDGVMIWLGYAAVLGTLIYFVIWAGVISTHMSKWFYSLVHLFQTGP